jgi:hypothetical protein
MIYIPNVWLKPCLKWHVLCVWREYERMKTLIVLLRGAPGLSACRSWGARTKHARATPRHRRAPPGTRARWIEAQRSIFFTSSCRNIPPKLQELVFDSFIAINARYFVKKILKNCHHSIMAIPVKTDHSKFFSTLFCRCPFTHILLIPQRTHRVILN